MNCANRYNRARKALSIYFRYHDQLGIIQNSPPLPYYLPQASAYALMHSCAATLGPGKKKKIEQIAQGRYSQVLFRFAFIKTQFQNVSPKITGKESNCSAGDPSSIPGSVRSPEERNGSPTPVSLSEKSHGQRSLVDYSP